MSLIHHVNKNIQICCLYLVSAVLRWTKNIPSLSSNGLYRCEPLLSPLTESKVHLTEVLHATLKLSSSAQNEIPYSIPYLSQALHILFEDTKRLQMMKLTHPESAGCNVPRLKLEFLPHYQCKTAFEVSWKNLNPMTTPCTSSSVTKPRAMLWKPNEDTDENVTLFHPNSL